MVVDENWQRDTFLPSNPLHTALAFVAIYVAYASAWSLYSVFFSPLSNIPGPKLNAASKLPLFHYVWSGVESTAIPQLHRKYGQVVRISPNNVSLTGDKELWKQIYGFPNSGAGRSSGATAFRKDPLFYEVPFLKSESIIHTNNENHSRLRKIVSHAFSDKALKEQEPMLKNWALQLRDKLAEFAAQKKTVDMVLMMNCTTFDVMADMTFGKPLYMLQNAEYVPWVKTIFDGLKAQSRLRSLRNLSSYVDVVLVNLIGKIPAIMRATYDQFIFINKRVDDRLANHPDRPDIWSRILQKGGPTSPDGLTMDEHYSTALIFMVAGTETTATALSGTLYYLLQNPQYLRKLTEEIRATFKTFDDLKLEPLQAHSYLEAIIKEGLRLYPPGPTSIARVVPQGGAIVAGHFLPEGTQIGIHQLATCHSERNFRNPLEFHPERWLGDPEYYNDNRDSFEVFSVGPRNCVGKNLAWHEMRLLLATILLHFDFKLMPDSQNWIRQKIFTLWDKPALMCSLTERQTHE